MKHGARLHPTQPVSGGPGYRPRQKPANPEKTDTKRRAHLDPYSQETLGERCYRLRNALGLTLRAVARGAGISAPYMSDIEHDRRCPSDAVLRELAGMLHVPRETLEAPMLNRDTLRTLNLDPELVRLIRLVMSDRRCRCLVLDAAGLTQENKARR